MINLIELKNAQKISKAHLQVCLWRHFQRIWSWGLWPNQWINLLMHSWHGGEKESWTLVGGSRSLSVCPWGCILSWSLLVFLSLLPVHHDVSCSDLPRPPHHDGLNPLKLWAKIFPRLARFYQLFLSSNINTTNRVWYYDERNRSTWKAVDLSSLLLCVSH
jgi:hypothetical protein